MGKNKTGPPQEPQLEDHEAELAAEEATEELRQESDQLGEREYRKMAADLRWEVLEYVDAHPDKPVLEVAALFGLREGTIRAWKAHRTMGTYQERSNGGAGTAGASRASGEETSPAGAAPGRRQAQLFPERREKPARSFLERKRYSTFIHYFDKTPPGIVCPHFYILAHANGCPFMCDYCYLRLTLRHYPEPTVFTNTARMFQELRDWLLSTEEPAVLNAGELSDGLAWDPETMLSANLVPLFEAQNRHKLLLLTKSTAVANLLKMEPTPQAIVSFSVNAEETSRLFERGAPAPVRRLEAAQRLKDAGWEVRIRLDPMIPIEGWPDHYSEVIDRINRLGPKVVTLGTLRYFKNLLHHVPGETPVFNYGRDHNDPDGRLRVLEETRMEMYRLALDRLDCMRVGLCKETEKMHRSLNLPGMNQSCNCTME